MTERSPTAVDEVPLRALRAGRLLARLRRAELAVAGLCLVVIVAVVLWGVATRYISPRPAAWTGEVASIAFCWCSLLMAGALYARAIHPRIFEPGRFFLPGLRRPAMALTVLVEFAVLAATGYFGGLEVVKHLDNPTSILRLPVSIYYLPLVWFSLSGLLGLLARG